MRLDRAYKPLLWFFALAMVGAGVQELRGAPDLVEAANRLGYPPYLLTMLGIAKIVGAAVLVAPGVERLKEWAFAGFAFDFGGAIVSHVVVGDTLAQTLPAIVAGGLLALLLALRARQGATAG